MPLLPVAELAVPPSCGQDDIAASHLPMLQGDTWPQLLAVAAAASAGKRWQPAVGGGEDHGTKRSLFPLPEKSRWCLEWTQKRKQKRGQGCVSDNDSCLNNVHFEMWLPFQQHQWYHSQTPCQELYKGIVHTCCTHARYCSSPVIRHPHLPASRVISSLPVAWPFSLSPRVNFHQRIKSSWQLSSSHAASDFSRDILCTGSTLRIVANWFIRENNVSSSLVSFIHL